MINIETLKFYKMLDILAALSKNGIQEISDATNENFEDKIFYDEKTANELGYCKVVKSYSFINMIPFSNYCFKDYYGEFTEDYDMSVAFQKEGKPYIVMHLAGCEDEIVIEDGEWYFA